MYEIKKKGRLMGDEISIGNVRFNKDDVQRHSVTRDKDGDNLYSVFLKNGTSIKFYEQKSSAKASVTTGFDMGNKNKEGTAFSGIVGLSIQGTNKDDYYHLRDCDYYVVDVDGGGKDEVRVVNTKGEPESATINNDSADKVYNVDISHGISRSEGWFVKSEGWFAPNLEEDTVPRPPQTIISETDTR